MQLQTLFLQGARPPAAAWALDGDGVRWLLARQVWLSAAWQVFTQEQESSDLFIASDAGLWPGLQQVSVPCGEVKLFPMSWVWLVHTPRLAAAAQGSAA